MAWSEPDTSDRVKEQMARAVYLNGVWYRRNDADDLEVWPVRRLDRLARLELRLNHRPAGDV